MIWTVIGIAAALLTSFGFAPQLIKIWVRRSAEDVSTLMLVQFAAGLSLWAVYGFYLQDPIVVGANLVSLIQVLLTIVLVFRLRAGK